MKLSLLAIISTLLIAASAGMTSAQSLSSSNTPSANPGGILSTLTAEEKARLIEARKQVLASNPDLEAERVALVKQSQALSADPDATPEEKMAHFQSFMAHEEKMKAAILKLDPTMAPILDKLDQQMKQKMAQYAAMRGGAGN